MKNGAEIKCEKYDSEDSLKTIASKKVKIESKSKETQEEHSTLPHKSAFDVNVERLVNSNASPSKEVTSTVPLESSFKMILIMKITITKKAEFIIFCDAYFKLKMFFTVSCVSCTFHRSSI